MRVRAIKEGVLDGRVIDIGQEFDVSLAPAEWFDAKSGWLELIDPLERFRRMAPSSSKPFRNALHPSHGPLFPDPPEAA